VEPDSDFAELERLRQQIIEDCSSLARSECQLQQLNNSFRVLTLLLADGGDPEAMTA
jgi:hypothetical protein